MKNTGAQTDEQCVNAEAQTDQLKTLKPISSLFNHSVEDSEEEDDEEAAPQQSAGVGHYRRANTFSGASAKEKALHGRGLGRKRMYIYNTGD